MRNKMRLVLAALLLDLLVGEQPNRWHPVAWMGTLISGLRRRSPRGDATQQLAYGGAITIGGSVVIWIGASAAVGISEKLPRPLGWIVQAWLLKTAFSIRGLNHAALEVETALRAGNLPEARRLLSWHLVSRKTAALDEGQIAGAAISSVAENTSDGIIAPLLWYAVGGLPAALMYRYVNTGDSILGYRDTEREWLGKIPARADDLLNLIPARMTALLFVIQRPRAWRAWRRDARLTASPNAGQPMSAMAGALDVRLEKVDHYLLNAGARPPHADDIRESRWLMFGAAALFTGLILVAEHLLRKDDD